MRRRSTLRIALRSTLHLRERARRSFRGWSAAGLTTLLVAALALPLACASDDAARRAPASENAAAVAESEEEKEREFTALIEGAIARSREIRESWQRGDPRDFDEETAVLEMFLRAAELRPDRVEGPYGAAVMLVTACQSDRKACSAVCPLALTLLDHADAIESGYRYSTWNRGVCLEGTGRFEEALLCAEQSLAEYPEDPDMWALRAKVRISLGYLDAACGDLARMFDLMGLGDEIEARIEPYGCRIIQGVPRYVPTHEPGIQL